jgi:hypothetical protein
VVQLQATVHTDGCQQHAGILESILALCRMKVLYAWVLAMNYSAKVSQSDAAGLELLHQVTVHSFNYHIPIEDCSIIC